MNRIEKLSHYAVVVLAVSALVVSVWQANITIQHNKLTVKPYLDYRLTQQDSVLTVNFSNEGFGPAILEKVDFYYQGKHFKTIWGVLEEMGEVDNWRGSFNYGTGTVISPGANKLLISLHGGSDPRGIKTVMLYKSIYEEAKPYRLELNY